MVAGWGTARGSRGPWPRSVATLDSRLSATTAVKLLEGDHVPIWIAHHEPARSPVSRLGLHGDVVSLRQRAKAGVDVVDVQVHVEARDVRAVQQPARRARSPGDHALDAPPRERGAAVRAVAAPIVDHGPAEHVAVEGERRFVIGRLDEEMVEPVDHAGRAADCLACSCASTTQRAAMLMMRRTVAVGVRMCTGLAAPSRIGPTGIPAPPTTLRRLNQMFTASSVGMMRRLASTLSRALRNALRRTSSGHAA